MTMDADDRIAVEDVLIRYCTAIDAKDWALFRTCFAAEASAIYGSRHYETLDALTNYMEPLHADLDSSLHRLTNIAITGQNPLQTRSYVAAVLVRREHPKGPTLRAEGYYDDVLTHTEAGWRILKRRFTCVWQTGNDEISGRRVGA
jgi:3-phenylpropionate/cinnamic acid dioxygenase small subunit